MHLMLADLRFQAPPSSAPIDPHGLDFFYLFECGFPRSGFEFLANSTFSWLDLFLEHKQGRRYNQRRKIQPAATKVVLPEKKKGRPPETAVPVLKLYYHISVEAGLDESVAALKRRAQTDPAGRRRRLFQY